MNSNNPSAFAKAREEIQLWPAAAMAIYHQQHPSVLSIAGFVFLVFTGATTYKFHESIRREIDSSKSFRKVKSKVSRSGSDWTFSDRFRFALELWNAHRPENQLAYSIVTISLFSNLIGGLGLYVWLSTKLLHQLGSSLVALSLWSLPALMLATIGSVYLWTS